MYEAFFGLSERPFDLTPNPKFVVLTDAHREALSNLEYGIGGRRGVTLLVGEAGSGKTTIIRTAIARQPNAVHVVHLTNPTLSRSEFVEMLATRFDLSVEARGSKTRFLIEVEQLLRDRAGRGETTVLILDEAQSLPLDLLEEVRLLANIESDSEKLLQVIMAGQPELAVRLNLTELRQLKQRVGLRCELRRLTPRETASCIEGRIKTAGGRAQDLFTREAVALIHQRANGLPRLICVLADNALLGGFAAGTRPVPAAIVAEVSRDFDLGPAFSNARPTMPAARPANGEEATSGAVETTTQSPTEERGLFGRLAPRRKRLSLFGN